MPRNFENQRMGQKDWSMKAMERLDDEQLTKVLTGPDNIPPEKVEDFVGWTYTKGTTRATISLRLVSNANKGQMIEVLKNGKKKISSTYNLS